MYVRNKKYKYKIGVTGVCFRVMLHKYEKKHLIEIIIKIIKLECSDGKLFEYFQGMHIVYFFLTNAKKRVKF